MDFYLLDKITICGIISKDYDERSVDMEKNKGYTNESIKSLKGADRVRLRPGVIFGSDGLEGCEHSVFEIISNSIDEAREGYGDKINVTHYSDGSIEVEDFGRGIPVDYNANEGKYNWELLFCELYAGGKYDKSDGDSYSYSLGLNGLGLCSTQYASEYMDVEIKRDGKKYSLHFEEGECVGGLKTEDYSGRQTGSKIRWKPDNKVFTDTNIPKEYFIDTLLRQSVVNEGIKFIFREQEGRSFNTTEYYYENGIKDYLAEIVADKAFTQVSCWSGEYVGRDRADLPEYSFKIKAALAFSTTNTIKELYHNSSWLEHGGTSDKGAKSALLSQIDSYLRENNKYQKGESRISFQDIEECLALVVSSFSTITSFENQTKKSITNAFIQTATTDFFKKQLEIYFIENKADAEKIAEQVLINKRSREKSEKERLNIKKTLQQKADLANKVAKFVDCRSRDVEKRELFIVEGDSALGACKLARDAEFQAIMPVRGKILNCLKAEYNKIFKSEIITDLIKVMGCGVEVNSKANKNLSTFDLAKLQWNKIIICTDADVDGFQIRTLILTMLYRLTPQLIEEGMVYIAETPLFEIESKGHTYFAYSEKEKTDILATLGNAKYTLQRSKGLGENEPGMMNLTTMNPATRRLIKIMPEDAKLTSDIFDLLLGDNLAGRKQYIADNGHLYIDMADVQ